LTIGRMYRSDDKDKDDKVKRGGIEVQRSAMDEGEGRGSMGPV
jgi:hypothetical protein